MAKLWKFFFRPCWYDSATVLLFHLEWLGVPPVILYTYLAGPRCPLWTHVIKWMGRDLQNHTCPGRGSQGLGFALLKWRPKMPEGTRQVRGIFLCNSYGLGIKAKNRIAPNPCSNFLGRPVWLA